MKLSEVNFCLSAMQSGHFPKDGKPEVAFVGRSNVGKSSLLNTLFHRKELARTSSRPGKTQTINFFEVNKRCYFVDLPGYGFAKVPKDIKDAWNRLMHQYLTARGQLKLAVVLLDARHAPSANDQEMLDMLEESAVPTLVVATKSDKLSKNQLNASLALMRRELGLDKEAVVVPFSAVTGDGSRELWQIIGEVLA